MAARRCGEAPCGRQASRTDRATAIDRSRRRGGHCGHRYHQEGHRRPWIRFHHRRGRQGLLLPSRRPDGIARLRPTRRRREGPVRRRAEPQGRPREERPERLTRSPNDRPRTSRAVFSMPSHYSRGVDRPRLRARRNIALDAAIKAVTIGLLVWAVLSPELPQFRDKAFIGRAIAYPIALSAIPIGWWLLGRRIPFPVAADILFGLPFLIDVVGNALNLYDSIEWWDDANHLVNWMLHTAAIGLLLRHGTWGRATRTALAFGYAATSAVV